MHTIRLIYSSTAVQALHYRDILLIIDKAAEANRERSITGMLCYGGGQFLQVLEGERGAVNTLYHRIARDPRHASCTLLRVEEIEGRDFGEWSMKIIDWTDAATATSARQSLLEKHSASNTFDPRLMSGAQAAAFLKALAAAERALME